MAHGTENLPMYRMNPDARSENAWQCVKLPAGEASTVCSITGAGVINRFWCTWIPQGPENNNDTGRALRVNFTWDNAELPAVSVPLADFFCQPLQLCAIQNHFFHASSDLCVFNALIPMPFRDGARLEIVNGTDAELLFWYGLDIEHKPLPEDALYFHAAWQNITDHPASQAIDVLPTLEGSGRYLGTQVALLQDEVQPDWSWYCRPVRIYLDKLRPVVDIDTFDDYVCSGWWSKERTRKPYMEPFSGRPHVCERADGSLTVACYRYHVRDPLWFHDSMSVVFGANTSEAPGLGNWALTSYFYLNRP